MSSTPPTTVPGPGDHPLLGHARALRNDPIRLFSQGVEHFGDIVRFQLFWKPIYLVNHPEYAKHILLDNHANYTKRTHGVKKLRVFGKGLALSDGELWKKQRKLIQPAFRHHHLAMFAEIMIKNANDLSQELCAARNSGATVNLSSKFTQLTLKVVCQTLFGAEAAGLRGLQTPIAYLMHEARVRTYRFPHLPPWIPTPGNLKFNRARRTLAQFIASLVREHSREGAPADNLLAMLLAAKDPATGEGMSATQLKDEIQTFLLAGHDTTANNLAWTVYLLSRYPEVKRRVIEEIRRVVGHQGISLSTLEDLSYTRAVILESLRYYPPVWILPRSPLRDDVIGGYRIPAGSSVYISPYLIHRHRDFWRNANDFDPTRFTGGCADDIAKFAFIPFGAGPRQCVGRQFALTESLIVLATILNHYDLSTTQILEPRPGVTLRPSSNLIARVHSPGTPLHRQSDRQSRPEHAKSPHDR